MSFEHEQASIEDALLGIYGKSVYVPVLAEELLATVNRLIDAGEDIHSPRIFARVQNRIWDFFPGGDTAERAADAVIKALIEAGVC